MKRFSKTLGRYLRKSKFRLKKLQANKFALGDMSESVKEKRKYSRFIER